MKLRQFVLVVFLVGGFWFVTTHFSSNLNPLKLMSVRSSDSPLELSEAHAAPEFDSEEQNNISVYRHVLPSVVNITSRAVTFNFFYGNVPQEGQGSGFVLDKAGHVLTNFHVIEGANRGIEVKLSNKRSYKATVVGTDKVHDLALLKVDAPDLQPVVLADSSQLAVGKSVCHRQPFRPQRHHDPGIISSIRSIRSTTERRLKTPSRPMPPSIPATPVVRC